MSNCKQKAIASLAGLAGSLPMRPSLHLLCELKRISSQEKSEQSNWQYIGKNSDNCLYYNVGFLEWLSLQIWREFKKTVQKICCILYSRMHKPCLKKHNIHHWIMHIDNVVQVATLWRIASRSPSTNVIFLRLDHPLADLLGPSWQAIGYSSLVWIFQSE